MTLVSSDSLVRAAITIFHREQKLITPESIQAFIQNGRGWPITLEEVTRIWDDCMKVAYQDIKEREELINRLAKEK